MKQLVLSLLLLLGSLAFAETEETYIENELCKVYGTLDWSGNPETAQPLVILIAGSGPTDRNGNNPQMENNSLKMFSEMLVAEGYACLRYDKRGIAKSQLPKDFDNKNHSFDGFIEDAKLWIEKYAADARFNQIILCGHSQGSLVAMCAANGNEQVGGIISLAGAGERIHEVLKKQLAVQLSVEMQGLVNAKLDTLAMGDTLKEAPKMLHSIMHPSIQPFLISWMKYDPVKQIKALKVPILLINGTTDIQVKLDQLNRLAEAKPEAPAIKIKNMNHVLKYIKTDDMGEQVELYGNPYAPLHKKLSKPVFKFLSQF